MVVGLHRHYRFDGEVFLAIISANSCLEIAAACVYMEGRELAKLAKNHDESTITGVGLLSPRQPYLPSTMLSFVTLSGS